YVAVNRVEFPLGDGIAVPTQLIVAPMLLLLPTTGVPLLVVFATVLSTGNDVVRGGRIWNRAVLAASDAAFVLAPAAVLVALDAESPHWAAWPAYAAALLAQFAADVVRECARALLTGRVAPR